jgi:hypothetical protein
MPEVWATKRKLRTAILSFIACLNPSPISFEYFILPVGAVTEMMKGL